MMNKDMNALNSLNSAQLNFQNAAMAEQSFTVPVLGMKVPKGPFTDKREVERNEQIASQIESVMAEVNKALAAARTGGSATE